MNKFAAFVMSVVSLTACTGPDPDESVAVSDIIDNIHAWDGKIVTVSGWLGTCEGYDCGLYSSLADAKIAARVSDSNVDWKAAMDRRVSLAFETKFDQAAHPLQFKRVVIRAKISDECRGWFTGCTDRAPDLYPISIKLNSPKKVK